MTRTRIGDWVRDQRTAAGLRQIDVALLVGVDLGTVSRWERGRGVPSLEQFVVMCRRFGASADVALGLAPRLSRRRAC